MWSNELRYLFDLNGYVVIKDYFSKERIHRLRESIIHLEGESDYPDPVCLGKPRTKSELYLSNIAEYNRYFEKIISDPLIVEFMSKTTSNFFRFNHSYAISHWRGGATHLHMGGYPIHPKAVYMVRNGDIFSSLSKAVIPLDNHGVDDGCFCVVPGSHKANFENDFNLGPPEKHPAVVPVPAQPGDLILFTEALQHGGLENVSGRTRRTIYYCYSLGSMPDWGTLGLHCSEKLRTHSDDAIREIVRMKMGPR